MAPESKLFSEEIQHILPRTQQSRLTSSCCWLVHPPPCLSFIPTVSVLHSFGRKNGQIAHCSLLQQQIMKTNIQRLWPG